MRNTKQRELILDTLKPHFDHPTANTIYDEVRVLMPNISLGTVYRNLEKLSDDGKILKLEIGGGQKRFDPNTHQHSHFRCLTCGNIEDFPSEIEPSLDVFNSENVWSKDRVVLGVIQDYFGYCSNCKNEQDD